MVPGGKQIQTDTTSQIYQKLVLLKMSSMKNFIFSGMLWAGLLFSRIVQKNN